MTGPRAKTLVRLAAKAAGEMFFSGDPCKRGHGVVRYTSTGYCIQCIRERARKYQAEHSVEAQARWDKYHERNPHARTEAQRRWRKSHADRHAHLEAARKAKRRKAVPRWADLARIREFYRSVPPGYQVDHIVPINHPRVCGLHVIENLQYLDALHNTAKSNSFVVDAEDIVITAHIPWRDDGNLGAAYNEIMSSAPIGSWVIFKDHDCIFTTNKWAVQIAEAIAAEPNAGAFVSMTNRIASAWQRCGDMQSNDIAEHRRFGTQRLKIRSMLEISQTKGWGGVLFALSRDAWAKVGGFADGLGCADHSIHFKLQDAGYKTWLIEGLYVYHWRHWNEADPTSIFPKAAGCRCRGPEVFPTERVSLP